MPPYPLAARTVGRILADKARRHGARPFLLFEDERYSYAEADRLTNRVAQGLLGLGVKRGDHVAVLMGNSPDMLWTLLALGKIGAVAVPINLAARGDLLQYFLNQSDSRLLVADGEITDRLLPLEDSLTRLGQVVVRGEGAFGSFRGRPVVPYPEIAAAPDTPPPDTVRFSDPHYILYTSGTTGPSKGIVACHAQGFSVAETFSRHVALGPSDVLYTCLPLFHANALWNTTYTAIWNDAAVALSRRFSASGFWSEIRRVGATQFAALGAMITILWKQAPRPDDADNPARLCFTVPTPAEFIHAFARRFDLGIVTWFSMTENFPLTLFVPGDPPEKMASAGRPRGEAEVKVVDEHDAELPAGEIGELVFRPRDPWSAMLGYYRMPETTLENARNLWFHTGDLAYFDREGWLWFVDRKKDCIRRRGENISAWELELILAKHEDVLEVAAVPVPSELGEDEVMVYVVPRPGHRLTPESVVAFCQAHMPHFMVPRYIDFSDELPKTPTQKVEKYRLRAKARAELDRIWDRERAGIRIARS
ncbi:MAG: ATP-dependent acyl-CoA ligase [Candidatus Rokubacteria bacterium]|nr:ATP-dependent acyl-CoA ligase [Candidatus Rokubacteria bacterium]